MKIHMDYLENKVEHLQSREKEYSKEINALKNQLEVSHDKLSMIKDAKSQETREAIKRLDDYKYRH